VFGSLYVYIFRVLLVLMEDATVKRSFSFRKVTVNLL